MMLFQPASTSLHGAPDGHAKFLPMLPAITAHAQRAFRTSPTHDREEAVQAVVAYAFIAYARLVELQKPELAYPTPLAQFGIRQHRAGRLIGGRVNCRDVGSTRCGRLGCVVERFDDLKEAICDARHATPAEIAALRIDLSNWLRTLSPRDQRLAVALARGEQTWSVAEMFRITAGRVSQLRKELYDSWRRFTADPVEMA